MAEAVKEKQGYIIIPYEFFKNGFTSAGILILGKVFTFSTMRNVKESICRSSFRDFARDFGLSERQVARKIKALKKGEFVNQDKSLRACASYTYTGGKCEKAFIRSDLYLYQKQFEIQGEGKRYLTLSEILVLSLIMTHCSNPGTGKFLGSVRAIAKILGFSSSTVQRCLDVLERARLISSPKAEKAVNGSSRSVYYINRNLLKKTRKEYKKEVKASYVDPKVADADARTDRERYYDEARKRAQAPAEQAQERLQADPEYSGAEKAFNALKIPQARAEIAGDAREQQRITDEQRHWQAVMSKRMKALNISREDLQPRYRCPKCSDTGYKPDGHSCDCYPLKGGRT